MKYPIHSFSPLCKKYVRVSNELKFCVWKQDNFSKRRGAHGVSIEEIVKQILFGSNYLQISEKKKEIKLSLNLNY